MSALASLARKWRHGTFGLFLLDRLEPLGILIRPFWLVEEGSGGAALPPLPDGVVVRKLDRAATLALAQREVPAAAADDYAQRLDRNCECHALVDEGVTDGAVLGCMWVDRARCRSWVDFALAPGEVYLFDARILHAHRGRGLAPAFRAAMYSRLGEEGVTRFISVTDAFNKPAHRFKQKLGARKWRLYLLLRLFGRVDRTFKLRER